MTEHLPPRLRPPRHKADPLARRWWTAQALLTVTAPATLTGLALFVPALLFFPGALVWLGPPLALLVAPALAYALVMPSWRYKVHGWELGTLAVYAASGWFWQKRRIVPLSRVQTVDTVRGPLQRSYGLATVTVTTASTHGDVKIAGLSDADAEHLARRIGEAAQLVPGDAT
ncbi:PH domain-containing protein [Sphaerisporangium fuscum]|uniref:PH domain-containing protein n=1 Tax=Sphaerisporangium fuscum TaxID=2835868 RepID=UPI001BDC1B0E|nr:PH domain-containing protein [Sphaerisporangium fuscum]